MCTLFLTEDHLQWLKIKHPGFGLAAPCTFNGDRLCACIPFFLQRTTCNDWESIRGQISLHNVPLMETGSGYMYVYPISDKRYKLFWLMADPNGCCSSLRWLARLSLPTAFWQQNRYSVCTRVLPLCNYVDLEVCAKNINCGKRGKINGGYGWANVQM